MIQRKSVLRITRYPFPKGKARRAKKILELIHSDLCGPMSETTWGGARYLLDAQINSVPFLKKLSLYL